MLIKIERMNKMKNQNYQEIYKRTAEECLIEGIDKYVVQTYRNDIISKAFPSVNDLIIAKIVLTWRDKALNYKIRDYQASPYKIVTRMKVQNKVGANSKYRILYLPNESVYKIQIPNNKKEFLSLDEIMSFMEKYRRLEKEVLAVYSNNIVFSIDNSVEKKRGDDFLGMFYDKNTYQSAAYASVLIKNRIVIDTGNKPTILVDMNKWNKKTEQIRINTKDAKNKELNKFQKDVARYIGKSTEQITESDIKNFICDKMSFQKYEFLKKAADQFETFKNVEKRCSYYTDIFCDKNGNFCSKDAYEVIKLLGSIRQQSFHENDQSTWLFELDEKLTDFQKATLDRLTNSKIETVNREFVDINYENFNILFKAYPNESQSDIVRDYYNFSIKKAQKNLGFSITALREAMLENQNLLLPIKDKSYDSIRHKLYGLFDFVIYKYYIQNPEKIDSLVDSLRKAAVSTDNDEKLNIYIKEADKVWNEIGDCFVNKIVPGIDNIKSSGNKKKKSVPVNLNSSLESTFIKTTDISYFAKALYIVASFLDGKEINMLLDSIINELDNIASFNDVLKTLNMPLEYQNRYSFFENAKQEADNVRIIKSIAKMNKTKIAVKNSNDKIKLQRYIDAGKVLGENNEKKIVNSFNLEDKKADHTFRNFIINNVINSNRFIYIMRFVKPQDTRKIMQSRAAVEFALKDIPESQIVRYCKSVDIDFDNENPDYTEMKSRLTNMLLQVNFDKFSGVSNSPRAAVKKEQLKAVLGLYLTVAYLIVKSIVRINMSYTIAFSVFERDCVILNTKFGEKVFGIKKGKNKTDNIIGVTNYFMQQPKFNKRVKHLVEMNKNICNDATYRNYRNMVMHLNIVSVFPIYLKDFEHINSYFDLYQYVLFKKLYEVNGTKKPKDKFLTDEALKKYDLVMKYKTANKDFTYALNSLFAYNPARYINLSCKKKFEKSYGK